MGKSRTEETAGINRRSALRILTTAAAAPLLGSPLLGLPGYHPQVPAVEADRLWRPRFFQPAELETVEVLAELLIPATDTPGAREALVHQYIDFTLSREQTYRKAIRDGLLWIDEKAANDHGVRFSELEQQQQTALLESIAEPGSGRSDVGGGLFDAMKRLTIRGYYRSAPGMHEELGYDGSRYLSRFEGCTHPEHHDWSPSKTVDSEEA